MRNKNETYEPTKIAPFSKMEISANVKWDFDEGDTPPNPKFEVSFTPDELVHFGVLDKGDIDETNWWLNEGKLGDFIAEYVTDYTDFCHNGLEYTYTTK